MAKKKAAIGVNKSQAIRDALKANPGKKPKEIAALLSDKGVSVTAQYVSMVKGASKGKKKTVKLRKPKKGAPLGPLASAIEFIRAAGGMDGAKQALAAIDELKGLS